jgi:hypothetical protein
MKGIDYLGLKMLGIPSEDWTGTKFQAWIVTNARLNGWTVRVMDQRNTRGVLRAQSMDQRGWPDLLLVGGSRAVWIECKSKGEALSSIQMLRHAQLRHTGHEVISLTAGDWRVVMDVIASIVLPVHP